MEDSNVFRIIELRKEAELQITVSQLARREKVE